MRERSTNKVEEYVNKTNQYFRQADILGDPWQIGLFHTPILSKITNHIFSILILRNGHLIIYHYYLAKTDSFDTF